jgi:carboxyl-terminal processing protease
MLRRIIHTLLLTAVFSQPCFAKLPEIDENDVVSKVAEIMQAHVKHKEMTPDLMGRALQRFMEELDPSKTYLIRPDIADFLEADATSLEAEVQRFHERDFQTYERLHAVMLRAIDRRQAIEDALEAAELPEGVKAKEFQDLDWAESEEELHTRISRIKALQAEASEAFDPEQRDLAQKRIQKMRVKFQEELQTADSLERKRLILSKIIKAIASSLDAHTSYFTPDEASQFMIAVQQRLFGIGAQLRDDLNGLTVVKIIEGGPAERGEDLKVKDRIIAVDNEPIVGMEISDAVELIRGEAGRIVHLTVMRPAAEGNKGEEKLEIKIERGEVVLKDYRVESAIEPFGDGVIVYLKLFSFYQDPESSSALDLTRELRSFQKEHDVKGVVLDLRYNAGGLLSQAVAVTGMFISRGVVASIKDDAGRVQHLRDLDGQKVWDGPLVVLTNRVSASAAEIVAQTLQDYGRALVVGDDHTFGKGTFQTFTLTSAKQAEVDPKGEYKVTRGTYFTVSGRTPQLHGVLADIEVPGPLSEADIGEQYADYALEVDVIPPLFDDQLLDIPESQRRRVASLYRMNLQPRLDVYRQHLDRLRENAQVRIENNTHYQAFLEEIRKEDIDRDELEQFDGVDFQLTEAYNIIKDLVVLSRV